MPTPLHAAGATSIGKEADCVEMIETPAKRRHLRCRGSLVLDLVTRCGTFWEHVEELHSKWGIEAIQCIPPPLPPNTAIHPGNSPGSMHFPSMWPDRPFGSRLDEPPPAPPSDPILREEYERNWRLKWWEDVSAVATVDVPDECQVDGYFRADAFTPFVAACVLYDPPIDQLVDFANAPPWVPVGPPIPEFKGGEVPIEQAANIAVIGPPIVARQDANAVRGVVARHNDALIAAMAATVRSSGIDLRAIQRALGRERRYSVVGLVEELRAIPYEHYIQVRSETTQEEVVAAYKLLRAAQPTSASVKERDPLICVQCAIWHAGAKPKLVMRQIAAELDRLVPKQARDAPKTTPETARNYVREGKQILEARGRTSQKLVPDGSSA